ncbi:MAG: flippase-like domain-containing protein [Anaerolineales bacterium]|nr:flippase-like domain-containing protein [Anaerolineales bacterium]
MKRYLKPANLFGLALLAAALLAFRLLPWRAMGAILSTLSALEILILLVVNAAILLLFSARWWLILRAFGYRIPYYQLSIYRIAGFAISYFTPGTQFGGEPLQVYLATSRHGVPASTSTAAVALDKLFELCANFTFLAAGVLFIASSGLLPGLASPGLALWAGAFLALPLLYFWSLSTGRRPLSTLVQRLPARLFSQRWLKAIPSLVTATEGQIAHFFQDHLTTAFAALAISGLVWLAMVFEYRLMTAFLGANLNLSQAIAGFTATRLAFLTPLPGGVGLLEASQALALQAFGFSQAAGLSISLLIRSRDILIGLFGLWLGARAGWKSTTSTTSIPVQVNSQAFAPPTSIPAPQPVTLPADPWRQ